MLIEASESSSLCASLSLCQTLFTFSGGISHREGWWMDLNSRQSGVCGRKTQTETDKECRMGDRLRKRAGRRCRAAADSPDPPANPLTSSHLSNKSIQMVHQKACRPLISSDWTMTKERLCIDNYPAYEDWYLWPTAVCGTEKHKENPQRDILFKFFKVRSAELANLSVW